MSVSLGANGGTYQYPQENDPAGWGDDATDWASAVSAALSNIGLGASVSADAVVNIISTSKGILVPRMTTTQRNAIGSPSTSLLIYNTTTTQYELYTGSTWQSLASYISGTLTVTGAASLQSTLNVTGSSTFSNVTVTGNATLGDATADVTAVTGILNVDSGVLYVDPTNNRVGINTTGPTTALTVGGASTLNGTLSVTGNTTLANVTGANVTATGTILTANGSVTAPFIAPSGDPNTGLYVISADKIGIAANGARVGEWGAGYGGFTGNVIQVVTSTSTYAHTISGNALTDIKSGATTTWEVTITPRYNNSRIIIIGSIGLYTTRSGADVYISLLIDRKIGSGSYSNIYKGIEDVNGGYNYGIGAGGASSSSFYNQCIFIYEDLPATTSQLTYKFPIKPYYANQSTLISSSSTNGANKSYIYLIEVQA